MEYVIIGKIVNTHGIKGEIRILSNFEFKEKIFKEGFNLYIGPLKEKVTISTYRHHKNFDMCIFKEYNYINDVLKFKGEKVYIDKNDLILDKGEILDSDLIKMNAYYNNTCIGRISDIINNNGYKLFLINNKYIPYNKEFIEKIDIPNKKVIFKNIEGLL